MSSALSMPSLKTVSHANSFEAYDKRDLVEVKRLIDLTDQPIGLSGDQINWSRVRSTASNCICCCYDDSITLITTNDSYSLECVPIDNIQHAQANSNLQYLALSNHRKLVVVDLVESDENCLANSSSDGSLSTKLGSKSEHGRDVKVINLAAFGLTMDHVVFWTWIDEVTLGIVTHDALYVSSVNQTKISHPAMTALSDRSRHLSVQKVFEIHKNISSYCQISDILRDRSGSVYAIVSNYSASKLPGLKPSTYSYSNLSALATHVSASSLRSNFGSVPNKLSQLIHFDQSFDSVKSEGSTDDRRSHKPAQFSTNSEDDTCGLIQIYLKSHERSQLIQAHAITFTYTSQVVLNRRCSTLSKDLEGSINIEPSKSDPEATLLITANKVDTRLRVHFIEMSTQNNNPSSGFRQSADSRFDLLSGIDFPTAINATHLKSSDGRTLHVAMITTKFGQLFVYSVNHGTLLFNTSITTNVISSAILEKTSRGIMLICRNGHVLLAKLALDRLIKLLDESKTLKHISSHSVLSSLDSHNNNDHSIRNAEKTQKLCNSIESVNNNQLSASLDTGLEVIMSTKL